MSDSGWSRRELLKSVGTGAVALATGAAIYQRMTPYVVGARSDAGVAAASSVSDTDPRRIDLTAHTPWHLVRGTFSSSRVEALHAREDVAFVQPDRWLETVATPRSGTNREQTIPWGVARIGATVVHDAGHTADGVDIGVIDTGIQATHPAVAANVAPPEAADAHKSWVDCQGEACDYAWSDDSGHGTHVAGTAAASDRTAGTLGVAPGATLHALKVCGSSGRCRTSAIAKAIRYAADNGWDVVNLSLGAPKQSPALQAAGEYAVESGVVPVAAAGNQGRPDSVNYPAAYDEFLCVSATTIDDEIARFSSRGSAVDLAAPGADVCAPIIDGYGTRSGTSMAAPHVAGAVAHMVADGASPIEARRRLAETAADIDRPATEQGAGLVDVAAALGYDHDGDTGDGVSCPADLSS